ncbi:hypothetical protein TRVL_07764 [Trypanosoma vivax]|nr:hypothetical protein TRVL_07764 [Trypanosoma vivax]
MPRGNQFVSDAQKGRCNRRLATGKTQDNTENSASQLLSADNKAKESEGTWAHQRPRAANCSPRGPHERSRRIFVSCTSAGLPRGLIFGLKRFSLCRHPL